MPSKLKKMFQDLIIYSALLSDCEKPDFKNDALAGVRANFFNAKGSPQTERTELVLDGRDCALYCTMKRGEPLSWKITRGGAPYQTVKRSFDGSYCVITYGDNGIVTKRQFFGIDHLWRRTEQPFADALHTLLPMFYAALPLAMMPYLHYEMNVLVMCIVMVWVNDSFAYMGGSLVGRHKMWLGGHCHRCGRCSGYGCAGRSSVQNSACVVRLDGAGTGVQHRGYAG